MGNLAVVVMENLMMNKTAKSILALGLLTLLSGKPAQAALYTADGNLGQKLIITILDNQPPAGVELGFWLQFFGTLNISDIGIAGNLGTALPQTLSTSTTNFETWTLSKTKGSVNATGGSIYLTPETNSFVKINTQHIALKSATYQITAVPEPETYALMGIGLLGLMLLNHRRQQAKDQERLFLG